MAESTYLKPKVRVGDMGVRRRERGQILNVDSYTKLGGFSSSNKLPDQDPPMTLEKGPSAEKGKPI